MMNVMGLELGIDLSCYSSSEFDSEILRILPLAYDLLERNEFGKILEVQDKKHLFRHCHIVIYSFCIQIII